MTDLTLDAFSGMIKDEIRGKLKKEAANLFPHEPSEKRLIYRPLPPHARAYIGPDLFLYTPSVLFNLPK
jgi:hypothetical protein